MAIALIVLAAMLLTGVLFADELQLGSRYRGLLSRFTQRPPS